MVKGEINKLFSENKLNNVTTYLDQSDTFIAL